MKTYNLLSANSLTKNSSGGQLLKWKVGNTYIKTSTLDNTSLQAKFMYESFAEVISSRIGQRLGLDIVKYKLCEVIIDNSIKTIACESKEFKPIGYKEFSFGKLMQIGKLPILQYNNISNYRDLINDCKKHLRIDIQSYIDTILIFDSLILNDDRHYGNFGILSNNIDIQTMPLFDNGNSLFCHKHTEDITYDKDLINYLKFKPFNINCNVQLELVKSSTINIDKLSRLENYISNLLSELTQQGLPKNRAKFIKDLLKDRINYTIYKYSIH